jgi:hypothetical protein
MFPHKSCPGCEISPLVLELIKLLSVLKHLPFVAYKLSVVVLLRLPEFYLFLKYLFMHFEYGF